MVKNPTLLEILGGQPVIEAVVEEFYQRVLADPALRQFFAGVPMRRLIGHQVAFISRTLSGKPYNPAVMQKAHFGKGITDVHFDRVAQHLVETLRSMGVSESLVAEVVARVAPLRVDVVERRAAAAPGVLAAEAAL